MNSYQQCHPCQELLFDHGMYSDLKRKGVLAHKARPTSLEIPWEDGILFAVFHNPTTCTVYKFKWSINDQHKVWSRKGVPITYQFMNAWALCRSDYVTYEEYTSGGSLGPSSLSFRRDLLQLQVFQSIQNIISCMYIHNMFILKDSLILE